MKREDGFYWVKDYGHWKVAMLYNNIWYCCGSTYGFTDDLFECVGDKIEKPED